MLLLVRIATVGATLVPSGTLGAFENEGNFAVDAGGNLDWASVAPTVLVDDTLDTGFQGSSKEEKPDDWVCNLGGSTPGKGNLLRVYVNIRISEDFGFLDLAWIREEGGGDAHLNFEFNQQGSPVPAVLPGPCPTVRTPGDVLVTYDFDGNASSSADIRTSTWTGLEWSEIALDASGAVAATNSGLIADDPVIAGTQPVDVREFGEATLNLHSSSLEGDFLNCPGFGFVNVRSRSSESISSGMQDWVAAQQVDLSTCGQIVVHKVDDGNPAHPLAGAVFGLFTDAAGTVQVGSCTSQDDGTCTFGSVAPSPPAFYVKELSAPAGYSPSATIAGPITVDERETVDVQTPFVNPRDTGFLRITKTLEDENGNPVVPGRLSGLNGASFVVYSDDGDGTYEPPGETALLWPSSTPAACTITDDLGYCDIGPLPTGSYRVHETAAPGGTNLGPDIDVTVTKGTVPVEFVYTNTLDPLDIAIDKSGTDLAHEDELVTYTFTVGTTGPPLSGIVVEDSRCSPVTGPIHAVGDDNNLLEQGESWTYSCQYRVSGSPDPLTNYATATGVDDFGRSIAAFDSHTLDVLHQAIAVDKKVNGGDYDAAQPLVVHEGDTLEYTVLITNTGDTRLEVVSLSDSLTSDLPASCSAGIGSNLDLGATISCAYTSTAGEDSHNAVSVTGEDALGGAVSASDGTFVDVIHPSISLAKSGPAQAHEGDLVTYSFNVRNTGDAPLAEVAVADDVLGAVGTISILAPGATETLTALFKVPTGAADIINTALACGEDPLGAPVCDGDGHSLDPIHPAIELVKTADPVSVSGPAGLVTFTYVVTNVGDVLLTGVTVTDDVIGAIGSIGSLDPQSSVTLTKTVIVTTSSPTRNVGKASGSDPLGRAVEDSDDATISIVLPVLIVAPPGAAASAAPHGPLALKAAELPRTGADIGVLLSMSLLAILLGGVLNGLGRRRAGVLDDLLRAPVFEVGLGAPGAGFPPASLRLGSCADCWTTR